MATYQHLSTVAQFDILVRNGKSLSECLEKGLYYKL